MKMAKENYTLVKFLFRTQIYKFTNTDVSVISQYRQSYVDQALLSMQHNVFLYSQWVRRQKAPHMSEEDKVFKSVSLLWSC